MTAEVTVTSVAPDSFTFTVEPGEPHFLAPGSTISFTAAAGSSPGSINFTVQANGSTANAFFSLADWFGGHSGEAATWTNLLNNLASWCKRSN
jgi:hypothetical protein